MLAFCRAVRLVFHVVISGIVLRSWKICGPFYYSEQMAKEVDFPGNAETKEHLGAFSALRRETSITPFSLSQSFQALSMAWTH